MDGPDLTTPVAKACTKCGEVKPPAGFYQDKRARDGLQSSCRKCHGLATMAWRAANPERARAHKAAHYAANRERYDAQTRAWRVANPERARANAATYYAANRERARIVGAAWRKANPERKRASVVAWKQNNPERLRDQMRAYYAAHPEASSERDALRRARKRNAPVVERIYRAKVWERDGGRCHICGKKADPNNWHLEHLIPLSRGGEHSYRNVAVAHPACNMIKGVTGPAQLRLGG